MLHHASFTARDPEAVSAWLGEIVGGQAVRAPTPPFPAGAWFVCVGDAAGSYIEVLPQGWVFDGAEPHGLTEATGAETRTGWHLLLATSFSAEDLLACAEAVGWRAKIAHTPLFSVVQVWIEGRTLLEFLPPEFAQSYRDTFGAAGIATLDAKLRALEAGA